MWIEPTAPGLSSEAVLVEEEAIVAWAIDAGLAEPQPSTTVHVEGLDVLQADAAAAVAGWDELVLVVGPAGAGKTMMLARAREALHRHTVPVVGSGTDRQSGTGVGAGHRDVRRHGRQAALRVVPPRPGT